MIVCQREWSCERCGTRGAVESPSQIHVNDLAVMIYRDHVERAPACRFDVNYVCIVDGKLSLPIGGLVDEWLKLPPPGA